MRNSTYRGASLARSVHVKKKEHDYIHSGYVRRISIAFDSKTERVCALDVYRTNVYFGV